MNLYDVAAALGLERSPLLHSGKYREVFQHGHTAVKVIHPTTRVWGIPVPTSLCTRVKYGIRDLNEHEHRNYEMLRRRLPEELHKHFAHVIGVEEWNGISILRSELVVDFDCDSPGIQVSKTLAEHGPVSDTRFWADMAVIEDTLAERKISYLDAGPQNLLVQRTAGGRVPVFVDHKRIGYSMYRFQPHLLFPGAMERKMRRKFARLRDRYQA